MPQAMGAQVAFSRTASYLSQSEECSQHRSNCVRRQDRKLFCDLAPAPNQPVLSSPLSIFIADSIEDCSCKNMDNSASLLPPIDCQLPVTDVVPRAAAGRCAT